MRAHEFIIETKNIKFDHNFDYDYDDQIKGVLINAMIGDKPIGHLELTTDDPYYGIFYVEYSELQPEYRGQGIGKAMYQYARDLPEVKELNPGASQSPEAKKLWSKMKENFADGKVKGKSRPGRVKRSGASCSGSVADLRKRAKNSSGERAKMYHWCANMKSGKKK